MYYRAKINTMRFQKIRLKDMEILIGTIRSSGIVLINQYCYFRINSWLILWNRSIDISVFQYFGIFINHNQLLYIYILILDL